MRHARPALGLALGLALAGCSKDVDQWLVDVRAEDEYERLLAVTALGIADPAGRERAVAEALVNVLEDPEDDVARAALAAITRIAPRIAPALVELAARADVVRYLGAPPPVFVRQSAAAMVEKAGSAAVAPLVAALQDARTIDRGLIANTLGRLGVPAIAPLLELARTSADPFTRSLATMGLGRALGAAPHAVRGMIDGMATGDPREAALALVRDSLRWTLPETIDEAWVVLRLERLFGGDAAAALQAEIELRLVVDQLVPHLIALLERGARVANPAALMLTRLDARGLTRAFLALDPERAAHAAVLERLLHVFPQPGRALPALLTLAVDAPAPLARRALLVITGLGAEATPALVTLRALARAGPADRRAHAAQAIATIEARLRE